MKRKGAHKFTTYANNSDLKSMEKMVGKGFVPFDDQFDIIQYYINEIQRGREFDSYLNVLILLEKFYDGEYRYSDIILGKLENSKLVRIIPYVFKRLAKEEAILSDMHLFRKYPQEFYEDYFLNLENDNIKYDISKYLTLEKASESLLRTGEIDIVFEIAKFSESMELFSDKCENILFSLMVHENRIGGEGALIDFLNNNLSDMPVNALTKFSSMSVFDGHTLILMCEEHLVKRRESAIDSILGDD